MIRKVTVPTLILVFVGASSLWAMPSLYFSTKVGSAYSWIAQKVGTGYEMSFENIVVDTSVPTCSELIGDEVVLPTLAISQMQYSISYLPNPITGIPIPIKTVTAVLTPVGDGKVKVVDQTLGTVLEAQLGTGGLLSISRTYMAYSNPTNDLSALTGMTGYSPVIDAFIQAANEGLAIDLSFTGDSTAELYADEPVSGGISGQISAIPAPEPLTLAVLGLLSLTALRKRLTAS